MGIFDRFRPSGEPPGRTYESQRGQLSEDEQALAGKASAAELATQLLMRGTRSKSRQQIQDEMQRLNATIGIGGGIASVSANISTTSDNLIAAIPQRAADPTFEAQALSGFLSVVVDPERPRVWGPALADAITGLYAAQGVLAALVARGR